MNDKRIRISVEVLKNKIIKIRLDDKKKVKENIKKRINIILEENQKIFNVDFHKYRCNCNKLVGLNLAMFLLDKHFENVKEK